MRPQSNLIPIAIIIAAVIIAAALFFSRKDVTPTSVSTPHTQATIPAAAHLDEIFTTTSNDHILGNPEARVTIIEYSDIDCPFCSKFHKTMKRIIAEYGKDGDVAWVYRHLPIPAVHPDAEVKAHAAECVAEIGGENAFWTYLDILFLGDESTKDLASLAQDIRVNTENFATCMRSGTYQSTITKQAADAFAIGATGTPYNVIIGPDGEPLPAPGNIPHNDLVEIIETLLTEEPTG